MRLTLTAAFVVALGAASAWLHAQGAQQPAPRPEFHGGVELVQLDVSVLDGKRRPVRGLTASDFTVLENGVPRPIQAFSAVDLPGPKAPSASAAWTNTVRPDVATNEVGEQDGRLVIILMDRTIPPGQPTLAARKIATAAVDALGPDDLAAVVSTSGGVPRNLTADRDRLIQAIDQRDWSTDISAEAKEIYDSFLVPVPNMDPRCLCGICVLHTIQRIAEAVRAAPRRQKTLLFIGSSITLIKGPSVPSDDVGCDRLVREARTAMFDSLALSSLTVHSIDPSGLVTAGPQSNASLAGRPPPGQSALGYLSGQMQKDTNDRLANQGTLHVLPDRTGGRVVVNTNAPEKQVPAIFDESDAYYVLGFEPARPVSEDGRASIAVKVNRKGVQVHAQRQYAPLATRAAALPSPGSGAPSSLAAALGGLLPVAGTPLRLAVAAFAGSGGDRATVSVTIGAGALVGAEATAAALDVGVVAVDQTGREVGSARQMSTIDLPARPSPQPDDVDVPMRVDLGPGDYEIRAGVEDQQTHTVASVFSQVTVPAFASAPLSLSDVVLEMGAADNALAAGLPVAMAPTTRRAFTRTAAARAFVQVYEGTGRTDPLVPRPSRRTSWTRRDGR